MVRFLLLLGCLLSCYPTLAQQPEPFTVHGQLRQAPTGDSLRLSYPNGASSRTLTVALGATGTFALRESALQQPVYAQLRYAQQTVTLYLMPGDQLRLTVDFPRFQQTLRYTGRGAAANNYLTQALYTFEEGPPGTIPRPQDHLTAATTPQQARQDADAFRQAQHAFLTTYAAANPLPAAFQRDAAEHIDLQWALGLLAYPSEYQRLAHRAPVLPTTYYDFLPQMLPHALDRPGHGRYRSSADNTLVARCLLFYSQRLLASGQLSTDPAQGEQLYATAAAELPPASRDLALFMLLSGQVKTNLPGVAAAYPAFRTHSADSVLTRRLGELITSQRQQIAAGQGPTFTLADHTGKVVSLADYKGKVVYLDFWGTWCAPCLAEMPASNALRQQFAGRDVVFIYVAVGSPEARWQQVIADAQLAGPSSVHVRSPNQVVPEAFGVTGYPTYLLIGRDGRVRQAVAPRPSAGAETVAALEQALKE